ncbi:MAG: ImmA/IrrE family metallo-endopeptidase [Eubacteriales bacterium]
MNLSIYEDAERLAVRHKTRDPFELLDSMNVVVDFTDGFAKDGLKGFCAIINKTKYVIINNKLSSAEKRVVAGHEAGHIIRHSAELKVGAFKDNDIYMATGKKEREANVFAADFLIRDKDVIDLMKTCDSDFFNVAKSLYIPAPFFAFKLYSMVERGYVLRLPVDLDSRFLARKG